MDFYNKDGKLPYFHPDLGNVVVFYHCPCVDGIYSALVASEWSKTSKRVATGYTTSFWGLKAGTSMFDEQDALARVDDHTSTVILLDAIGSPDLLVSLCKIAKEVIVLDHHETSSNEVNALRKDDKFPDNLIVHFSEDKSGCKLAWDFFRNNASAPIVYDEDGIPMLRYLQTMIPMVQDHDLYKYNLPDTKPTITGLMSLRFEYNVAKNPAIFDQLLTLDVAKLNFLGKGLLVIREQKIDHIASKQSKPIVITGKDGNKYKGLFASCVDHTLVSDLGHQLAMRSKEEAFEPYGAIFTGMDGDKWKISLRSINGFDTQILSNAFGGGGHAPASAFRVTTEEYKAFFEFE